MLAGVVAATSALALDVITREELREMALEYGEYDQRFVTCKMQPPTSIRIAFLKYAKSRGASEEYLDQAAMVFDEDKAKVRNLRVGFSPEECKQKLDSPEGREILSNIEKWSKLPPWAGSCRAADSPTQWALDVAHGEAADRPPGAGARRRGARGTRPARRSGGELRRRQGLRVR